MKTKLPEGKDDGFFKTTTVNFSTLDELTLETLDKLAEFQAEYKLIPGVILLPAHIKVFYLSIKQLNDLKMDGLLFGCQVFFHQGEEIIIGSRYGIAMQREERMHGDLIHGTLKTAIKIPMGISEMEDTEK